MKKPKPIETARCSCFAHDRSECQCGAWHKPAPMVWHKLSEERPTEDGWYLTMNALLIYEIKYCSKKYCNQYLRGWTDVQFWCLITPPEREEK